MRSVWAYPPYYIRLSGRPMTSYNTEAIAHYKRTGCILPEYAGDVAAWVAQENGGDV